MSDPAALPRLDDFPFFLNRLRSLVFSSHKTAADYCRLSRSQITRYESGETVPESGYVACLMERIVERRGLGREAQEFLLDQYNTAVRRYYPDSSVLRDWPSLCQHAESFLAERHASFVGRQVVRNFRRKLSRQERTDLLLERIGPASTHRLVGMDETVQELLELLVQPGPPWVLAITGLGGIGKTSLAHEMARRVIEDELFDNLAWVNVRQQSQDLRKFGRRVERAVLDTEDLFDQLLSQLVPAVFTSTETAKLNALDLLQTRFDQIPHLVVIDNLETLSNRQEFLAQLQSLTNPTKFLLTSRVSLHDEPSVYHLSLPGLDKPDALVLLRREASQRNVRRILRAPNPDAAKALLEKIYATVGGNPLALRLIVGQAQTRPVDRILSNLSQVRGEKNESFFDYIFEDAWDHLSQRARIVLLSLLLSTRYGAGLGYLAALTRLSFDPLHDTLEQLATANVITDNNAITEQDLRYSIHSLTRSYLNHTLASAPAEFDALMGAATASSMRFWQERLAQMDGELPQEFQEQALHSLQYGLDRPGLWQTTRPFLLALAPRMEQSGARRGWIPHLSRGIRLSSQLRDQAGEAELRFHLGTLCQRIGEYTQAEQAFSQSAEIFESLQQPAQQAKALNRKAYLARLQQDLAQADQLAAQALALLPPQEPERAYSFLVQGTIALDQRRFGPAADFFRQSLEIWRGAGDQRMIAWSLTNLGAALRGLERYPDAIGAYEQAIAIFEEAHDPIHLSVAQMNLGNVFLVRNEPKKALDLYEQANRVFEEVQEQLRAAQIHLNMGIAHLELKQWAEAEFYFAQCVQEYDAFGNSRQVANGLDGLGLALMGKAEYASAAEKFQEALDRLDALIAANGSEQYRYEKLRRDIASHLDKARRHAAEDVD